ncbi:MAG: tetratricopeptide repeat protein [Proteobacteria bacterium]|nr:tetratricopeptide repeat protein [Pseudomonadota bacterium]
MNEISNLTALIVDPNTNMRGSLQNMLNLCGLTKIEHAVSAGTAIRQIQKKHHDVVLCEYDLGDGQDGQQLLEDLRHNKLIGPGIIYFIITAERMLDKVVGAAELAPTDYILKPFTADMLLERIGRALHKRAAFAPVHDMMSHGQLREALGACISGEVANPRYAADFQRLRADMHVSLNEPAAAETIYRQLIGDRDLAWARLGLASCLFMQGRLEEAENTLVDLLAENDKYMHAYDLLAQVREKMGKQDEAKAVLESAVAVSPHAVRRLRRLGEVALRAGDTDTAERSFQKVISKAKYSEFRDPEDHVKLVQSLVSKGDTDLASAMIRDLQKSLSGNDRMPACRALSSAMLYKTLGDAERTSQELSAAVVACRDQAGLSDELKMVLAQGCLTNNLEEEAAEVMLDVMNNASNDEDMARARQVLEQAGRADLADKLATESRRQVSDLVTSGVSKAHEGDFKGAVALMQEALKKMPDNPQVVFNSALAILRYLENLGWDTALGDRSRMLIEKMRGLEPANPKLEALSDLYQQIAVKRGVR